MGYVRVDPRIEALLGALLTPIAFTGYYVLVGTPRLPDPLGPYHASPRLWAFYLGPLAALGAVSTGLRTRLTTTATLATLALIGLPFYAPSALHGSPPRRELPRAIRSRRPPGRHRGVVDPIP